MDKTNRHWTFQLCYNTRGEVSLQIVRPGGSMRPTWMSFLALTLFVSTARLFSHQAAPAGQQTALTVDFATEVQPIFKTSCYACHSGSEPQAGLRLDVRSMALKGANGGPVIVAGDSKDSSLIHRVSGLGGLRPMPLTG